MVTGNPSATEPRCKYLVAAAKSAGMVVVARTTGMAETKAKTSHEKKVEALLEEFGLGKAEETVSDLLWEYDQIAAFRDRE